MLEQLFKYLEEIRPLSQEVKEILVKELEIIEVPKKQLLLKDGQRNDYVYVVIKGLLRMYYIKDEEEVCSRFMEEGHISISVYSFFTRNSGYEYIETLEPSTIARIHYDKLQKLYLEIESFNYTTRVITERYFVRSEERLFLLRKQTVEERYKYFSDIYPSLLLRVPLKYIASYLGTTIESLSRIRNKMSQNKIV